MNTQQVVKADERTRAVMLAAYTWGLNVITFGLLIDIIWKMAMLMALVALVAAVVAFVLATTKAM